MGWQGDIEKEGRIGEEGSAGRGDDGEEGGAKARSPSSTAATWLCCALMRFACLGLGPCRVAVDAADSESAQAERRGVAKDRLDECGSVNIA